MQLGERELAEELRRDACLHIGNHVLREHGARPWRFGAADYQAALRTAPLLGRPLHADAVQSSWDDALAVAMQTALRAIDEEMVAEVLLLDLRDA